MEFNNETIRIAVQLYVENEKEGEEKYGHINTWNVSGVTNMYCMFGFAESFNQPLNNWNVSNVTNMSFMFSDAYSFNQPLLNWDVSNVTNMFSMFRNSLLFNQPLNNWNVSNVTDMESMFKSAKLFNQPLLNWNVNNVTMMDDMFKNTTIGEMLKKHNLTNENYFDKKVYHELFVWPRKKDYVTFLVNNHYLPFNNHQEEHEYHPLFDNTDISKYIAIYL